MGAERRSPRLSGAPVAQLAEAVDLKSTQYGFDPRRGHKRAGQTGGMGSKQDHPPHLLLDPHNMLSIAAAVAGVTALRPM